MDQPVMLVVGHPRSGTSCVCGALEAGGLRVVRSDTRTGLLHGMDDGQWVINPGDVYETTHSERIDPHWPARHHGEVVKVVTFWVPLISADVGPYVVIFLRRDPEEIRQSAEASYRRGRRLSVDAVEASIASATASLRNRLDITAWADVSYAELVERPVQTLTSIQAATGLVFDIAASAATIDPAAYRMRRHGCPELGYPALTVGA